MTRAARDGDLRPSRWLERRNGVAMVLARVGVVLTLVAVATFWTRPAFACSCAGPPTFEEAVAEAEVVFSGEVVARRGGDAKVHVDRVYKGTAQEITVVHKDLAKWTSCRSDPIRLGPVVYAGGADLRTGPCAWDVWPAQAVSLPSYAPLPGEQDWGPSRVMVLVAVLAVAAAGWGTRRAFVARRNGL